MRLLIYHILLVTLVLLPVFAVVAQPPADTVKSLPGASIETSVDRAEIYVGDLITYKLTITYDSTYELIPPPLGANLGAFDVKDYQSDVIERLPDGRIRSNNSFVLSTFTTGDYVIPPVPITFILPDKSRTILLSEAVPIKVQSLLLNIDDSVDIKPLRDPYEFPRDWTGYYLWGGLALFVVALASVVIWMRIRRKRETGEPVDLRPAWEIAFEKLAILKQQNCPGNQKHKQYYIELTDILRAYLEKMFRTNFLDMTTEETLVALGRFELPDGVYDRTAAFLKHADLVKFAKFVPELARAESAFEEVHRLIEQIRQDYERRTQTQIRIETADHTAPAPGARS